MTHRICTAYGTLDTTYGGDEIPAEFQTYMQGILQGNGCGPQVWTVISSTIFHIWRNEGYAVDFISSISKEIILLCGFSYVDDCHLIQGNDDPLITSGLL